MDDDANARDIAAASPGVLPRVAGIAMTAAGLVSAFVAIQVFATFNLRGYFIWVLAAQIAVGVSVAFVGTNLMKARDWAAIGGVAVGLALTALNGAWVYLSFSSGYYSLLALMAVGSTFASTVMAGIAIPACGRASDARKNLKAAGLDLGL